MKKTINYDLIAGCYDSLSRMVFSNSQRTVQKEQLSMIPGNSSLLIVGGGTGWILEAITAIHPSGLTITYIELSLKMLDRSRRRYTGANIVRYIHSAAEDFQTDQKYDVVLTAFFFDNFLPEQAKHLFLHLDHKLKPEGIWLWSDFYYSYETGKKWQGLMLAIMYLFFRYVAHLNTKILIDPHSYFHSNNYLVLYSRFHYRGFIKGIVYRKSHSNKQGNSVLLP